MGFSIRKISFEIHTIQPFSMTNFRKIFEHELLLFLETKRHFWKRVVNFENRRGIRPVHTHAWSIIVLKIEFTSFEFESKSFEKINLKVKRDFCFEILYSKLFMGDIFVSFVRRSGLIIFTVFIFIIFTIHYNTPYA